MGGAPSSAAEGAATLAPTYLASPAASPTHARRAGGAAPPFAPARAPSPAPPRAESPRGRTAGAARRLGINLHHIVSHFAAIRRDRTYSFTAVERVPPNSPSVVTAATLREHRQRRSHALGVPTTVQYEDIPFELMTTYEVCVGVVKPCTAKEKCSYAEWLLKPPAKHPGAVRRATIFVSHAHAHVFVDVVDVMHVALPDDACVWFDVLCANQHRARSVSARAVRDAIADIGHTALVLAPWNDPVPLTRAWCLFEAFATIDAGARLDVKVPAHEQEALIDHLVQDGAGGVLAAIDRLDVERASTSDGEDRADILAALGRHPEEANSRIRERLRATWVTESARVALGRVSREARGTTTLLMHLAQLLEEQGKLREAEALLREALKGERRERGNAHPRTLRSLSGLARLLDRQGRLRHAEPLCREALAGYREACGADHPDTLRAINALASLLFQLGRYDEAEPLCREAVERRRRVLGDDHADTLKSARNLGVLLRERGGVSDPRVVEAEQLLREVVDGSRRVLGNGHPDTLRSIRALSGAVEKQGKLDEAEKLLREVVGGGEEGGREGRAPRAMEEGAPRAMEEGAPREMEEGAPREMEEGAPRAMEDGAPREMEEGALRSTHNLAVLLLKRGKCEEAEPLLRKVVGASAPDHPVTLKAKNNHIGLLLSQGRFEECECVEAVELCRTVLGDDDAETLKAIHNLGVLLSWNGEHAEAAGLFGEAAAGFGRVAGGAAEASRARSARMQAASAREAARAGGGCCPFLRGGSRPKAAAYSGAPA